MKKRIFLATTSVLCALILMSGTIDLENLFNYENQFIPQYITKDNTGSNTITDEIATIGRVLFYDKNLSANNTIACASCHIQERAFGDVAVQSVGLNGDVTGRHSMRLINARFANEVNFFWDERAASLEEQTTQPIQDHIEMGFSGENGDPDIDDLIEILESLDYYQELFEFAYGDTVITEERLQDALAQFIRSIQSFDSRFDEGLAQVNTINQNFPNYTPLENQGKQLFLTPPPNGGAGCVACHAAPEFDIGPNSLNNGVIGVAGSATEIDLTNTRAPSLKDVLNPDGTPNGPFMHDGSMATLLEVINHYDAIPNNPNNTNLDPRLRPGGQPQNLNLSDTEKDALIAFLGTLTGSDVYTNEKWSNPFDSDGNIDIIGGSLTSQELVFTKNIKVFPNPALNDVNISMESGDYMTTVFDLNGKLLLLQPMSGTTMIHITSLQRGMYILKIEDLETGNVFTKKIIKR